MTTELEQEFFKAFGIKQKCKRGKIVCAGRASNKCPTCQNNIYPEITDLKLLQLLCIYNDMQGCVEYCLTPCKYEDVKEMILSTLVNEKLAMIDCGKDTYMDDMTKQIQQLFKEGE